MATEGRRTSEMNPAPEIEMTVTGFAYGGRAVGRGPDGKVCFVRGAVPGETVRVRLTAEKKNYSEGVLSAVTEPSPQRLIPVCPNPCPGCSYAHVPYECELEWKQRQFRSLAEKAHLRSDPAQFLREPVGAPVRTGWRNKIRLSLEFSPDGTVRAGYRAEDNRTLIPVRECPLAMPEINATLRSGDWQKDLTGQEKTVTFRRTESDGVIFWTDRSAPPELLTEKLEGFGEFQVGAGSFFQIDPAMSGRLAAETVRLVKAADPALLAELYCGCGVFSILCAQQLPALHSIGIELDPGAIVCARKNAERHGVSVRTEFVAGDSAKMFRKRWPHGLPPGSLLLVDPPRTGLDPAMRDLICRSRAAGIIYISCGPDTLFRDLAQLENAGYRIRESRLLDLFPSTAHFESITFCAAGDDPAKRTMPA